MIGKKIGVQPNNELMWKTFLKINGIEASKVDRIVAGFDPQPLANGDVDGWVSYATDEPVSLGLKGIDTHTMLLADFGYDGIGQGIVVRKASLADENERRQIVDWIRADRKRRDDVVKEPKLGAELTVKRYGKKGGISMGLATGYLKAMLPLVTEGGDQLFTTSESLKEGIVKTMEVAGMKTSARALFDDSVLKELG